MESKFRFAQMIDKVVNPDAMNQSLKEVYTAEHTTVFRLEGAEPYAVRVSRSQPPDHFVRVEVLRGVGSVSGTIATILHSETRVIDKHSCTIDVMPFLEGEPLDRSPSPEETAAITATMYALHQGLRKVSPEFLESGFPRLADILHGLVSTSAPGSMKSRAEMLLDDERFMQLITCDELCLIYGDPWPSNFLIDREARPVKVRIVDVDPIFLGPALLQPALLFSAHFVTASILFEDAAVPDLDALIAAWPESIDRDDTLRLMRVYPILLSLVKLAEAAADPHSDSALLESNLSMLCRCLEIVDSYD